jgi:hypothetical protein
MLPSLTSFVDSKDVAEMAASDNGWVEAADPLTEHRAMGTVMGTERPQEGRDNDGDEEELEIEKEGEEEEEDDDDEEEDEEDDDNDDDDDDDDEDEDDGNEEGDDDDNDAADEMEAGEIEEKLLVAREDLFDDGGGEWDSSVFRS